MNDEVVILLGDCLQTLKTLDDACVQCVVTSPPYYGLRDYGMDGQIGLEETPEAYVEKLVQVFREVRRVLKDDGTLWLNLGDSYWTDSAPRKKSSDTFSDTWNPNDSAGNGGLRRTAAKHGDLKNKDLIGIPWMVAFALRADGWFLRQEIIWNKPNPMPESVTDRCTKSHEQIFLLSKNKSYYFDQDAIREPAKDSSIARLAQDIENQEGSERANGGKKTNDKMKAVSYKNLNYDGQQPNSMHLRRADGMADKSYVTANKKTVWTVSTKPYKEAHFATYPPDLIEPCILAGSKEGDVVLDPFNGSGTTGAVSIKHHRKYIGCDLNPEYVKLSKKRFSRVQPVLFRKAGE